MNEPNTPIKERYEPQKWIISIFKSLSSIIEINQLVDALKKNPQIIILNANLPDNNFCNHIVTLEFNGIESDIKRVIRRITTYLIEPYEIICDAHENIKLIGFSSGGEEWGITIHRQDFEILKPNFIQFSRPKIIHEDDIYLNFITKSQYFEIPLNPFTFFYVSPYPKNDPTFPWIDSGIRWKISKNANEYLWDSSGDDLSILPEMW